MKYTAQEVLQYVREEDVKFIRLAFCDVYGRQKNLSILPDQLPLAFERGIPFDASAIAGFGSSARSDLLLRPDPATLAGLPWRPDHGRVVRMYCTIAHPDGTPFVCDTRSLLLAAEERARAAGVTFSFGSELEFYLFRLDADGDRTLRPHDDAGYMDLAPDDRGENVRREICLTLEQMGLYPERSHHEEGPGQNEIDFRHATALCAADDAMTFQTVVRTVAHRNGLWADFSPKPLPGKPGNGFHINLSVEGAALEPVLAGILDHIADMTVFLDPTGPSYLRLGCDKAPHYISWSAENRSQLIRIPAADGAHRRAELRSPDPCADPYLAFALLIHAGLDGIERQLPLPPATDLDLFLAPPEVLSQLAALPSTLQQAAEHAAASPFIARCLPPELISAYCSRR